MTKLKSKLKLKEKPSLLKRIWAKIQHWTAVISGWKAAGTILIARVLSALGAWLLAAGAWDWSPVWNLFTIDTGFSWKQVLAVGGPVLITGIVLEITRRMNAKDMNG